MRGHQCHRALQIRQHGKRSDGVFLRAVALLNRQVSPRAGGSGAFGASHAQRGDQSEPKSPKQRGLEVRQQHLAAPTPHRRP